jgi:hypothetical protein
MTVPLWALACYPSWFGRISSHRRRSTNETQLFKDTYVRELQKYCQDSLILRVVQSERSDSKRRFADVAVLPWDSADVMSAWLAQDRKRH